MPRGAAVNVNDVPCAWAVGVVNVVVEVTVKSAKNALVVPATVIVQMMFDVEWTTGVVQARDEAAVGRAVRV